MHDADVIVVGGGNAALCAALTAREAGATVIMLEAAPREWRGGNSMHTRNLRCMHEHPADVLTGSYPEEEYWEDLAFYGFMLCFAATCVATVYHYALGLPAPYPLTSAPVVLGTLGGLGLLVGPAGLGWLYWQRDRLQMDAAQAPMDIAFIALLFFNGLTGLALMLLRDTGAMALLLAIHLGFVMALFLTLPYGKFAHGVYRCAALLIWAVDKRQPLRIAIKGE